MEIISKNMFGYNITYTYIYTYHSVYILGLYDAIHIYVYYIYNIYIYMEKIHHYYYI